MAWTSDAKNSWAARWLQWPEIGRFRAQVVKRTDRSPGDPDRQISVSIEGTQARITLDAQTGAEQADRHYLNFLPTEAVVVDPHGVQSSLTLPQVAPGRYQASMPVQNDGFYTLTTTQTEPDGTLVVRSGGFVVPYSPEYAMRATDQNQLAAIARRTGGRLITDPADAFAHTLPSVGMPRPLWPPMLVLVALLFVADVGVRRVRIAGPELRAGVFALRRHRGYIDDQSQGVGRLAQVATGRRFRLNASARVDRVPLVAAHEPVRRAPDRLRSMSPTRPGRLLAAKSRAARR
jgi:hypothetical protein